ncbi:UDP-glycosyltransferase 83A1 [Platanthera zijinensis]|uniref:UDP-glycosyltransferase 83A1 n=1 Tax=Platanthera zijinensis TaxID=2320716 RepID=A0AAP0B954_9ASPA
MAAAAPHALVFPFPAQSHIMSLLELSHCLLERGIKITFLNTEFNHFRLLAALPEKQGAAAAALRMADGIRLAAIPDGMTPTDDRNDLGRLIRSMMTEMPEFLEEFIAGNAGEVDGEERFTWFVADESMAWALAVAKKAGLRSAVYFPASAAVLAGSLSIPKLIEDGVIDEEGAPKEHKMFQLIPEMPPMDPTQLSWNCFNDPKKNLMFFRLLSKNIETVVPIAELILCNTFHELEKPVFSYAPNIIPVGPLLAGSRPQKTFGNFWVQETGCIEWLDRQPKNSVIYVAFGSFTVFNQHQFQELAVALELTGRPFLWVVRPGLSNVDDEIHE